MTTIEDRLRTAAKGRKLLAWSPIGSHMYGLATPESDSDFAGIVDGCHFSRQLIDGDLDMRFYTPDALIELLFDARISEVDMVMSGMLTYTANEYSDLFKHFRFNSNKYFKNSDSFAFKQAEYLAKHPDLSERRGYKALKAGLRAVFLAHRAIEQGPDFTAIFTAAQAAHYWASMDTLLEALREPQEQEHIMELLHRQAIMAAGMPTL